MITRKGGRAIEGMRRRGAALSLSCGGTQRMRPKALTVLTAGVRHRDDDELRNMWGGHSEDFDAGSGVEVGDGRHTLPGFNASPRDVPWVWVSGGGRAHGQPCPWCGQTIQEQHVVQNTTTLMARAKERPSSFAIGASWPGALTLAPHPACYRLGCPVATVLRVGCMAR